MKHQIIHFVRVSNSKGVAQVNGGVPVAHIAKGCFVVIVTVANTHRALSPLGVVEFRLCPFQSGDHVIADLLGGGFCCSLEIAPYPTGLELVVIIILSALFGEGSSG